MGYRHLFIQNPASLAVRNVPANGSVRLMVVTEKQYESMDLLLGRFCQEEITSQTDSSLTVL